MRWLCAASDSQTAFDPRVIIEDGVCKLADRSALAGSIATMDRLIRTMVTEARSRWKMPFAWLLKLRHASWVFTTVRGLCSEVRMRTSRFWIRLECPCCLGDG